ncbi:TetR-like C-terminal domain-containing protein [Bacterioplanes sanyensis]|nr:TetR-like C-terminal domain-containing protein [Bacterioplanes sanyensis]
MPRRKDHTHEQIRSLALDALLAHLQLGPLGDMSLRKLAQKIGYSPGTLINVFGSYDYLLLSVNARTLDQLAAALPLQQTPDVDQAQPQQAITQLLALAHSYLDFAQQHRYQWQLLFDHRLPAEQSLPLWQQQRINDLFAVLEGALSACAPQASSAECQHTARTLWAAVHGICTLALSEKLFSDNPQDGPSMMQSLVHHYVTAWCQTQQSTHRESNA